MAWRVMNSLLVLRDQVNLLAPNRSKGADGTICDVNHPTTSDHCPHAVKDVGPDMVTALDLTHDPLGGFDSYEFAETLRQHRDSRIKYVISNRRMFSSYATATFPAWTWRPYTATSDPHTNHVHISVLDAAISDTKTPWNLEGFVDMALTEADLTAIGLKVWNWDLLNGTPVRAAYEIMLDILEQARNNGGGIIALQAQLTEMKTQLDRIEAKLGQGGGGAFPTVSTFASTGTVTWTES